MFLTKLSTSLLFLMLGCSVFWSNAQEYNFNHLGLEEGLSQNSALVLHQDHLQRVWVGTREGLNCYDGESVRVYQPKANDSLSLLDYRVKAIAQIEHILWVMTDLGLTKLDLDTMKFERMPFDNPTTIAVYGKSLLIGTNKEGLYSFDTTRNEFKSIPEIAPKDDQIKKIEVYGDTVFIGTHSKGLIRYFPKENRADYFFENKVNNIVTIHLDQENKLWLGTELEGVYVLNTKMELSDQFNTTTPLALLSNDVRDIITDKDGKKWISTFRGINIIDNKIKTVQNVQPSVSNPRSLSHYSVFDLMLDKQGNLWAGTYFGGVNYTNVENQPFTYYPGEQDDQSQTNSYVIGNMVEDNKGGIWIATEDRGLNYLDTKTGKFKRYDKTPMLNYNIKSLLLTNDQKLYLGTHFRGLNSLDLKTGKTKKYFENANGEGPVPTRINEIIEYQGKLLLGTRSGLFTFDTESETFNDAFELAGKKITETVYGLYKDSNGRLWIGTVNRGLLCYDSRDNTLKRYIASTEQTNSLAANTIYKITEDGQSRIWIGTLGGGLSMYNEDTNDFSTYTKDKDNLPSDFILGIQHGEQGNLWISTSNGLSRLDTEEKKTHNYTRENGFPNMELNQGGLLLSTTGKLYIGGLKGLFSVNENALLKESKPFNLVFSKFAVNNKDVFAYDGSKIIDADISVAEKINLLPNQNSFSLEYASCNYSKSFNKYQYQLAGFDEDWIDAGNSTKINYTNLSSGSYKLKVRAVDVVYNTPISEKSVAIDIATPIYAEWYAYMSYALIIAGLIWLMIFAQRSFNRLRLERKEKESIMELNHYKLQFFTNVSHEIMTPLTLILGCLEIVKHSKKIPAALVDKLKIAHKNALSLKNLSLEFLDFRKMENGYIKLKVKEQNIVSFVKEVTFAFSDQAEKRKIDLGYDFPDTEINLLFDAFQMEKVFYNILSNAFKAVSDESGRIEVSIRELDQTIELFVKDNGPGIKDENKKYIFNRYYHIPNANNPKSGGNGIGLALSESVMKSHQGELSIAESNSDGTVFKITLKKGTSHFDTEELNLGVSENELAGNKNELTVFDVIKNDESILPGVEENETLPNILIVEDNLELLFLLKEILEVNSNVHLAKDGREGLKKAMEINPDLIILDVMIPEISGMDVCKKLKRNMNTSHIPIILLTAKSAMESKIEGLTSGADDYITKPFSTIYLKARIKNLFENRKRLHQKYGQPLKTEIKEIVQNETDLKFMTDLETILATHYVNENFNVDSFAQEVGMSRTLFFKKIKAITGHTPNEYIQIYKLRKAADMLSKGTDKNVSEIAYDVGFRSPQYFSKCFKDFFGVVPREFMKEQAS